FYFLPQAGYLRPDLSASDNIVPVLGETDRSALTKARACASDQNSFLAHMTCFLVNVTRFHLTKRKNRTLKTGTGRRGLTPNLIACEIDMFPAERRQMLKQLISIDPAENIGKSAKPP